MVDEVILAKAGIIERCLRRLDEEYAGRSENLRANWTRQDSILLNLERACQASIDLALRLIRLHRLGVPQDSRQAFLILRAQGLLPPALADSLAAMVGFRNVAIHNYRTLDLDIVEDILRHRLGDFRQLVALALQHPGPTR